MCSDNWFLQASCGHWPGISVSIFFYSQVELRSALWSETNWRQSLNGQLKHLLEFAAFNLTSLIKFSENEHSKWGQIEQRKWMENSIHLHALQSSQSVKICDQIKIFI